MSKNRDLGNYGSAALFDAHSDVVANTVVQRTADGSINANNVTASTFTGALSGTATSLATARTITLAGDVSGSASFDGSANVTITATVADDSHNHIIGNVDGLQDALDLKAPLASPTLTGVPAAPTANAGTNTTQIATTAFVQTAVAGIVDTAPETLDTLNELAAALGDDPNFATTVSNQIGGKVSKSGDTMSGPLELLEGSELRLRAGTDEDIGDIVWQYNNEDEKHRLWDGGEGINYRYNGGTAYKLVHAGNYNSYSPTLTGNNASGTWDISITGNANTVTNGLYTSGDQTKSGRLVIENPAQTVGTNDYFFEVYAPQGDSIGEVSIRFHQGNRWYQQIRNAGSGFRFTVGQANDLVPISASDIFGNIFYDNDNTAYYVNPNSTSNIVNLNINGDLDIKAGNTLYLRASNDGLQRVDSRPEDTVESRAHWYGVTSSGGTSNFRHAWYDGSVYMNWTASAQQLYLSRANGAILNVNGDVRAPIFYDTDDTGYYTDPAGVSVLKSVTSTARYIDVPGTNNGSYSWVRFWAGNFNGGGSPVVFSISRSIFDNGASPYGGCTARFTVTGREWHSGQENVEYFYTEHGSGNGSNSPFAYFITHLGFRDLQGGGYFVYMRLLNGVRYRFTASPDMNFNSNTLGGFEYNVADPGSVPQLRLGFGVLGTNATYNRITSGEIEGYNQIRAPIFYDTDNTNYYVDPSATGDSIRVAGNVATYYSDERLKEKLGSIENPINKVKSIEGFYYQANKTAQNLGYKAKKEVGLSAQQVQAVLPEIVSDAPIGHGYLTIDYARLVPLLVEAIKEQQTQIEALTSEINTLKEMIK